MRTAGAAPRIVHSTTSGGRARVPPGKRTQGKKHPALRNAYAGQLLLLRWSAILMLSRPAGLLKLAGGVTGGWVGQQRRELSRSSSRTDMYIKEGGREKGIRNTTTHALQGISPGEKGGPTRRREGPNRKTRPDMRRPRYMERATSPRPSNRKDGRRRFITSLF